MVLIPQTVVFMGDDIPDLKVMQLAGLPVCPADAVEEIKAISTYISPIPGGKGCARDIIEKVLKVQGKWLNAEAYSW
jgi:3-deoxy-D-manno-octulosonate 8-phosphate phosphatase (KDO 8-P phosphatase)